MSGPAPRSAAGLWRRAGRRPLVVLAGLLALAAVAAVVVAVVPAVARSLPSGSRVTIARADAEAAGPSTRSWYDRPTADGLAAELAAALDGTDWCAGWRIVQIDRYRGGTSFGTAAGSVDEGSNLGVDRPADECPQWVEVVVLYGFTSASSSQEDNAELWVESSHGTVARSLAGHPAFDVSADDLLLEDRGENSSDVIGDAIAALPLALAEQGRIDPLTVEPVGDDAPAGGEVAFADREGWGGSDAWRAERTTVLAGLVVALLGLAGLCLAFVPLTPRAPAVNPRRALKAALAAGTPGPAGRPPPPTRPPPPNPPVTPEETT